MDDLRPIDGQEIPRSSTCPVFNDLPRLCFLGGNVAQLLFFLWIAHRGNGRLPSIVLDTLENQSGEHARVHKTPTPLGVPSRSRLRSGKV
jgi:hypothetical protein